MDKKRMIHFKMLHNERGGILIISYFVMVVLLGLGAAFLSLSANEAKVVERERISAIAFHIAEAGVERALYDMSQDVINDDTPSWADDINGLTPVLDPAPNPDNMKTMPYSDNTFNGGSYTVKIINVGTEGTDAWIRSTGTYEGQTEGILTYVKIINLSPWNNAIFAGAGASGAMVNGNVDIRGSVHMLGSGLSTGDLAIDLGGTAELVGNNYSGCPADLVARVPALDTVEYNGETVETLNAELRVKRGVVGLSGSSSVGEADVPGNAVKETVDGVYINDGYGGNQGATNVFSDNGTTTGYDLGDLVSFPSISTDPHPDDTSQTFQNYFHNHSKVISGNLNTSSPFTYTDGTNSISLDASGNLTINGQIYVEGNLTVGDDITYTGKGTLLVSGDVSVSADILTPAPSAPGNSTFPDNIMAIMTPGNMTLGTSSQLDMMGLFYAEGTVEVNKQTNIMGTIVANYFDMGNQVPAIFQVPETVNNLPDGIISQDAFWYKIVSWQKI